MDKIQKSKYSNMNCSVYGCHSRWGQSKILSFHTFPRKNSRLVRITNKFNLIEKIDRKLAWERVLLRATPATQSLRVCSLHFKKEDFMLPDENHIRARLKYDAVPSCNLPTRISHGMQDTTTYIPTKRHRRKQETPQTILNKVTEPAAIDAGNQACCSNNRESLISIKDFYKSGTRKLLIKDEIPEKFTEPEKKENDSTFVIPISPPKRKYESPTDDPVPSTSGILKTYPGKRTSPAGPVLSTSCDIPKKRLRMDNEIDSLNSTEVQNSNDPTYAEIESVFLNEDSPIDPSAYSFENGLESMQTSEIDKKSENKNRTFVEYIYQVLVGLPPTKANQVRQKIYNILFQAEEESDVVVNQASSSNNVPSDNETVVKYETV